MADWQAVKQHGSLPKNGVAVTLYEQKPVHYSPAHHRNGLAELVCSNSLKADRLASAAGLLKAEMERMGSLLIPCARKTSVPAGGALAVDRDAFSDLVTEQIRSHPLITLETATIDEIPAGNVVVATGPLTEGKLAEQIEQLCGTRLRFLMRLHRLSSMKVWMRKKSFSLPLWQRNGGLYQLSDESGRIRGIL